MKAAVTDASFGRDLPCSECLLRYISLNSGTYGVQSAYANPGSRSYSSAERCEDEDLYM